MSDDEKDMEMGDEEWPGQMGEEGDLKSQNERIAPYQLMNSTGGYVYQTDYITQLMRFLCIGTTGGTYYTGEVELTRENARCIDRLINGGKGKEVVELVREFSVENRACKQRPIMYTLALCCRSNDPTTKVEGYKILSDVCRIPTHLFEFIKYCEEESAGTGWGRAHRRAISKWYLNYGKKEGGGAFLALHMTKYKNRFGWSHKDIFRLCHIKPEPEYPEIKYLIMVTTKGKKKTDESDFVQQEIRKPGFENSELKKVMTFMDAVTRAEHCTDAETMTRLILEHNLTREHVPTDLLKSKEIWKALIKHMPMTAMIRNLGKMSHLELLEPGTFEEELTIQKLTNPELLKRGRIHPFTLLVALNQYKKGHGELGKMKWKKNVKVEKALEDAFYLSFKNVKPTGKRFCLAVDVSGSMNVPVMGTPTISARDAAAAMMMVTARTEQNYEVVAFSGGLTPLDIKASDNLDNVLDKCASLPFCGTDCSRPMMYAMEKKKKFDVFVVYTDSETYFGQIHPSDALVRYRKMSGVTHARLIVCGMASNKFTIADPNDPMMMDIVGFDTNAPQAIHEFVTGHI
ncbi:RNA-binding protein RO60-like [Saccostrea echinata]|uniref:RNA-binding protein RO60-like n=1 Tax=Saccostrea echinata TaxID=191078 RepID=UPI002A7EDB05|nr:RNA-binding protein RO60-like [Saccostrea echinata]